MGPARSRQLAWIALAALIGGCSCCPTTIQLAFLGHIVGTGVSYKTAVLRENDLVIDRVTASARCDRAESTGRCKRSVTVMLSNRRTSRVTFGV